MVVSINFNGKNSFSDFDLVLEKRPALPLTLENVKNIAIDGRSGNLTMKLGTYNDKVITCKFKILSKTRLRARIDAVIYWLNYITDNSLTFSYDTSMVYKVKSVTCSENIQEIMRFYGEFEVAFTCEPFKYPISESTITKTETSFTITNSGTVESEPYIKIYGSGTITFTVNSNTITFTDVIDYIEIDSQFLLCYKDTVTNNMMSKMSGKHPVFQVGSNTVSGTFTQVDILVRTRYL